MRKILQGIRPARNRLAQGLFKGHALTTSLGGAKCSQRAMQNTQNTGLMMELDLYYRP
jgi:hypothetical protein